MKCCSVNPSEERTGRGHVGVCLVLQEHFILVSWRKVSKGKPNEPHGLRRQANLAKFPRIYIENLFYENVEIEGGCHSVVLIRFEFTVIILENI